MFPTFCGTRCREKKGESIQDLFPTHPTYQNPIFINPRPLLCKVSRFFGFSLFAKFFQFFSFLVANWCPKKAKKKEAILPTNEDFGKLSKFPKTKNGHFSDN